MTEQGRPGPEWTTWSVGTLRGRPLPVLGRPQLETPVVPVVQEADRGRRKPPPVSRPLGRQDPVPRNQNRAVRLAR